MRLLFIVQKLTVIEFKSRTGRLANNLSIDGRFNWREIAPIAWLIRWHFNGNSMRKGETPVIRFAPDLQLLKVNSLQMRNCANNNHIMPSDLKFAYINWQLANPG